MSRPSCKHTTTTQGPDRGYTCSVSVHPYTDENRAAHGGITYTEECTACGSRRRVNQNQWQVEFGTWGETRADREALARAELALARRKLAEAQRAVAAIEPLVLTHKSGGTATVTLDDDAMIIVDGAAWQDIEGAVARSAWLERAAKARKVLLDSSHAVASYETEVALCR